MITWIKDTIAMMSDIDRKTPWVGHWGKVLNAPQVLGGIAFITRPEAALILVACVGSVLVAAQIHKRTPFSRLTSIVHIVWLPLFAYLLNQLMTGGVNNFYDGWLVFVTVTIGISLVLDVWNLVLFIFTRNNAFEGSAK